MKRVMITGMGAASPLGVGVENTWQALTAGASGIRRSVALTDKGLCTDIAGTVPEGSAPGELELEREFSRKELTRNDRFILLARRAAREAVDASGWRPGTEHEQMRTGVVVGVGMGGFITIAEGAQKFAERGQHGVSPFFVPAVLSNLAGGQIAMEFGFRGPNYALSSACATGADAIMAGARMIRLEEAEVVVTGGAEAGVHPLAAAGFCQARTLSRRFNDTPEEASRPFDRDRDGFVMAEGGAVLVLEEMEHAQRRGAPILAELVGYATASDAYHITATDPEGRGEARVMRGALEMGRVNPEQVGYLNAHATSTPVGDRGELAAIRTVFGTGSSGPCVSSTKSATGHTLGAAGALEAVFAVRSLTDKVAPPTRNLHSPDADADGINLVARESRDLNTDYALSNAFGFGSTKSSLLFGRAG